MSAKRFDLTHTLLNVTLIGALLLGSLWVLSPFLMAALWAIMIVVASWPMMLSLQKRLYGQRWAAVCVMIIGLLFLLFLPFSLAISTLIDNADQIIALASSLKSLAVPQAPSWLINLPYVGSKLAPMWEQTAALGVQGLAIKVAPFAGDMTRWFVTRIGRTGLQLLQVALAIGISAVLYMQGEAAAAGLHRFATKLGGERGEAVLKLASGAIRGVALGVGVTALVQALLGGIGLALTGIPFAALLTTVMFILSIAQIGALPVLAPATIWLFWSGHTASGIFMTVWLVIVLNLDNFLRPWLIKRGADLPLLLILAGVIGGILSFGLVGIFLGPLLLAISYTLLNSWLENDILEHAPDSTQNTTLPETPAQT